MNKCLECGTTSNIVWSGVDAFLLGNIPTGTYCYDCANKNADEKQKANA